MNADDQIRKWLEGTLTPAEQSAFVQTEAYRRLQRMFTTAQHFRAPEFPVDAAFEKLLAARPATPLRSARQVWLAPLLRVAAMVILVAGGLAYWLYNPTTELATREAEQQAAYLPDSTQVTLNAATTIAYQSRKWETSRIVKLDGEAFFDVRKGSVFLVKTEMGEVSVLGTKFNVRLRGARLDVTCYEGKVAVITGETKTILTPGMSLVKQGNQPPRQSMTTEQAPHWLNNESRFESMPLGEVIQELERQYGTKVTLKDVDTSKLFSGSFTHDDLNVALESIAYPMHLTYKISADKKNVELAGETR